MNKLPKTINVFHDETDECALVFKINDIIDYIGKLEERIYETEAIIREIK